MSQLMAPASPQVMYSDGPEVFQSSQQPPAPSYVQTYHGSHAEITPRIFGLRRQTFWLVLVLLAVVIAAAIGGGVGGSLAVQNAKLKAYAFAQATTAVSVTPSGVYSSASSGSPTSSSAASDRTYTPELPNNILRVNGTCNSYNRFQVTVDNAVWEFSCNPGTDAGGNDIAGLVAYTLQHCLESCIRTSALNYGQKCVGVVFSENLSLFYQKYRANCFLKTNTTKKYNLAEVMVADLRGAVI
ncbi:hypothetical protein FB567DRAFT_548836 [Paraphoma chrysanthemicola]|uniref:Apple domain-containing protein n=1 Tax=Paraphoma chrysanthemicola TaxID=798071 RepID=A0A8K0VY75_9PLEO|nr:hypothetical protein FB567DRAFT_548836 [Paraphoma chrysanthemicola]